VILGESADDRKSTAIKQTLQFFTDHLYGYPACYGLGSAEGLAEIFSKQKAKAEAQRQLLIFDELKTFVSKARIETSVLLQTVNSLFEDNHYHSATKKHSIKIGDAHLGLLAASTVDTYSNLFDAAFLDIGFVNRLWLVKDTAPRRFALPSKPDANERHACGEEFGKVLSLLNENANSSTWEMELTREAYDLFENWYLSCPQTQVAKRLDTYGHRLMILLTLNQGKTEVDAEVVKDVIFLLNWQYDVRQELDPIDADSKIAAMEERIRRALRSGPLNGWELKKKVHYERYGIFVFDTALKNLLRAREIAIDNKTHTYSLVTVARHE
jgi:hypothetical protein